MVRRPGRVVARMETRPEHPLLTTLIERLEKERRLFRPSVDDDDGARLDDAGHVEELVALPQRLLARPLGRALKDGDRVANPFHDLRATRRELVGWKDVGAGKHRLGGGTREQEQQC